MTSLVYPAIRKKILISLLAALYCLSPGLARAQAHRYQQAYCAYQKEDFPSAARLFTSLLDDYPQLGDYVCRYLAQSRFALGDYAGALTSWQRLLKLYPQSRLKQIAKLGEAGAHLRLENYLAAAGIYRQLLMETLGNKEDIGQVYLNYGLGAGPRSHKPAGQGRRSLSAPLVSSPHCRYHSPGQATDGGVGGKVSLGASSAKGKILVATNQGPTAGAEI